MPGPVFLHGDRVELRTTEQEDVEFLQQARIDTELRTSLMFVLPQTREQVEEFYENSIAANNGDANFIVCRDGKPIGEASLFDIERDHIFSQGEYRDTLFYGLLRDEWSNDFVADQ
ncbi:GNAT family N-acetyltransferase [Haladaptatus sp. DFWS20]|uniref:GNAT family N-acetyltransferase n=1 Tax=Haladaptatus sp. DFWS20 TaxID=3403467 RepID=UPI003EB9FE9C